MRGRRVTLGAALVAMTVAVPLHATAKGSLAGFDRGYYLPGEVASGRLDPGPWRDLGEVAPPPRSVYLVPWELWRHHRRPSVLPTIPVDGETVSFGRPYVHVRFIVPPAPAGRYKVAICSTGGPCDAGTIIHLEGDRISVVGGRDEVPVWRELDRVRALASSVQRELDGALYALNRQHWRQVLQSRLASVQTQLDALSDRVEQNETPAAEPARSPSAMPTVAASSLAGVLAGVLFVAGRRRASRRAPHAGSPDR